eukprot:758726-Hanusia_phi.AAC.3
MYPLISPPYPCEPPRNPTSGGGWVPPLSEAPVPAQDYDGVGGHGSSSGLPTLAVTHPRNATIGRQR